MAAYSAQPLNDRSRKIGDLTFGAQLLTWGARAWVAGPQQWSMAQVAFKTGMGEPLGSRLAKAIDGLLVTYAESTQRTLRFGPLRCGRVWPDEEALLDAVHLVQSGYPESVDPIFDQFLPPVAVQTAVVEATAIAGALKAAGYSLNTEADAFDKIAERDVLVRVPSTIH